MNQAKQAVNNFIAKAGHKDTTVHETVAPAVQNETVREHQREESQVVKDREVHQDHHHTTVQPIKDKEVLPETHHHNLVGAEHRTQDLRNEHDTKQRLETEADQFKDTSHRITAQSATSTALPEVTGEHVHHHVHERVQPVIHKETIEPHVVHTTVPIHETIHNKAQHHGTSALPEVSLAEFNSSGGALGGRAERTDHFTGEPKTIDRVQRGHAQAHTGSGEHTGALGRGEQGALGQGNQGALGRGEQGDEKHKPSLMDKLNPKKDADGDGKAGFMS